MRLLTLLAVDAYVICRAVTAIFTPLGGADPLVEAGVGVAHLLPGAAWLRGWRVVDQAGRTISVKASLLEVDGQVLYASIYTEIW